MLSSEPENSLVPSEEDVRQLMVWVWPLSLVRSCVGRERGGGSGSGREGWGVSSSRRRLERFMKGRTHLVIALCHVVDVDALGVSTKHTSSASAEVGRVM